MATVDLTPLYTAFSAVYDALNEAYWDATSAEGKDTIRGVADQVFASLTALNQEVMDDSTPEFTALTAQVQQGCKQLSDLKAQIDGIVKDLKKVENVIDDIDTAVTQACAVLKFVPL